MSNQSAFHLRFGAGKIAAWVSILDYQSRDRFLLSIRLIFGSLGIYCGMFCFLAIGQTERFGQAKGENGSPNPNLNAQSVATASISRLEGQHSNFQSPSSSLPGTQDRVPAWARDAVFYQIFTERFRNGDRANDPTRLSLEFPEIIPATWSVTDWGRQWYARDPWETEMGTDFFKNGVFHRRYGGDLQGVIDKLDYLANLGINTIYFNPVFYARSMHKYDGNSFHHIDPHFGPDPRGDLEIIARETDDPSSWQWTSADKLFLTLIKEAHQRDIRVIIDGVFNHTGRDFFAFQEIVKNQQESQYLNWYVIHQFNDPNTIVNEFKYDCWWGVDTLPKFARNESGTDLHSAPKAYIFQATSRWMDPDGDGDPSDGIDGWRLDVANEVPDQFWQDWHREVRRINPQAFTIAEVWDESSEYLNRCGFSSTMNYHGFAFPVKGYLIDGRIKSSEFANLISERKDRHVPNVQFALQNLIDSHDTDRLASMIVNADQRLPYLRSDRFDYDLGERVSPRHFANYDVSRPGQRHRLIQRLVALFQMTYVGPPMIYYGTEAGMDGADDPCDRMPMIWDDLEYESRSLGPHGALEKTEPISFDKELFQYYRKLIGIRLQSNALRRGDFEIVHVDDERQVFAFQRAYQPDGEVMLVVLNRSDQTVVLSPEMPFLVERHFEMVMDSSSDKPAIEIRPIPESGMSVSPLSGQIWISRNENVGRRSQSKRKIEQAPPNW